ncbi:hypothetical protein [Agarivorans sp. QJM3NY_33]|uniref:hypothetical protein n=1 Tax=Agarivorans sp. QJM3NY_33 TaxID=3421432 RepID=UPI003D7DDC76
MVKNKFQCLSLRKKQTRDKCLTKLKTSEMSEIDLYILHGPELFSLWVAKQKSRGFSQSAISQQLEALGLPELAQNLFVSSTNLVNQFGGQIIDMKTMGILALDLRRGGSILGKYEITKNGAKSYISFKGNHKLRTVIKGTRYLSTNTKILTLGIGLQGLKASARGGVLLTILFSVSHHTLELVLQKDYVMTNWIVDVSSDVLKASIAACAGVLIGAAFISTQVVIIPIAIGLAVVFIVQSTLNATENRLQIKEKITASLNQAVEASAEKDIQHLEQKINTMKTINEMNYSAYKFF